MDGSHSADSDSEKSSRKYIVIQDAEAYSLDMFCVPKHYQPYLQSVLIPNGLILDRIERLARDICEDLDFQPITALCILKGGYRFFADLCDKIQAIGRTSERSIPMVLDFIRLKSYENDSSAGEVQVVGGDKMTDLRDKNVLVVEDIIDTGNTVVKLIELLQRHKPKRIIVASLLVKRTPLSNGYVPHYTGFSVPDHFVVGYAIDYNECFRDMAHVCVVNDLGKKKFAVEANNLND